MSPDSLNRMTRNKKWKWQPKQSSTTDGSFGIPEANLSVLKDIEGQIARYLHKNGFPLELEHSEHRKLLKSGDYRGRKLSPLDRAHFMVLWELINVRQCLEKEKHEEALFNALLMSSFAIGIHRIQVEPDLVRSKKVIAGAKKGAQSSSRTRQQKTEPLHSKIVTAAQKKLQKGLNPRNLAGTLAREFDLTPKQIANILKKRGLKQRKNPKQRTQ